VGHALRCHWQLQHGRSLAFHELRHKHPVSVWKLYRIVVTVRKMRVYHSEFSHSEIDGFGPNPSIVVFDILCERQFGPRKHADRYLGLAF
jgi:hypothetical protein